MPVRREVQVPREVARPCRALASQVHRVAGVLRWAFIGVLFAGGTSLLGLVGCASDGASSIRERARAALGHVQLEELTDPHSDLDPSSSQRLARVDRERGVLLGGGQDPRDAGGVLDRLRQGEALQKSASEQLAAEARQHMDLGELEEAEIKLEQAIASWGENEQARQWLDEVRMLRGDRRGEAPHMSRRLRDEARVERDLLRYEVERHLNQAELAYDKGDFSKAIDQYKKAADGIQNAPYDLDLDNYLTRAEQGLEKSEASQAAADEEERLALKKIVQSEKVSEDRESLKFVQNHIRALRRRADSALDDEDFNRAAGLYGQILELDPHDDAAMRNQRYASEREYITSLDRTIRSAAENYEKAVLAVEESSIIYQKIFRYPDKEEWLRLSPQRITIEQQADQEESAVTRNLRLRLSQPVSFGVEEETPLRDVLNDLQRLTGINFIIKSGDGDDLGEENVTMEQLKNLPVQDILSFLLKSLEAEEVGYVIREGAVVIAQGQENLREPEYLRFYEVSDITNRRPNFPAPDIALDAFSAGEGGDDADIDLGGDDEDEATPNIGADELKELIGKELGAGSGEEDEEDIEVEGIEILNGKLMARTTIQNHHKIATILDRLRKATGMMVTVESRFLDIQDNFLEEIGINFGSGSSTNLANNIPDIDGAGTAVAPGYEFIDARGDFNLRAATIGALSNPLGSQVNPFNLSSSGGGAYQLNVIDAERFQLEALLTAVAKEQEVRRLNSPRITAFNTQNAHTLVINQAAYIQDLEVNQTGVIPVINPVIGVLNTGSILEVRPTISYDRKYVVLEIQPTLAEQIGQDVAILTLAGNFTVVPVQLPIVSVTKIKTTVNVPDGGTVLLGGLKREVRTEASIGLPALRRIPILNLFFGRKGQSSLRSNLFVLINAKVTVVHEEEQELFGTGI